MKEYTEKMSTTEIVVFSATFADAFQSGETISSVIITHTPPSGSALTPTPSSSGTAIGTVLLGPLTVSGWHKLKMQGIGTLGTKPEVHWMINVS
jgi:hypothetical protein